MRVWTERRVGVWDQCTECAYLMVLEWAGQSFPLGAYTAAERDAFDAAHEPDFAGGGATFPICDKGSDKRYGLTLRRIADGTRTGLTRELSTVGNALAIAGRLSHFPPGHFLRRWQPSFSGGHAIAVVNDGQPKLLWLDPLAPDGHPGDRVSISDVLTFAWYPNDARVARKEEHGPMYIDVPPDHWAANDIEFVTEAGIMGGYDTAEGRAFKPNHPPTRAELAKTIRALVDYLNADTDPNA